MLLSTLILVTLKLIDCILIRFRIPSISYRPQVVKSRPVISYDPIVPDVERSVTAPSPPPTYSRPSISRLLHSYRHPSVQSRPSNPLRPPVVEQIPFVPAPPPPPSHSRPPIKTIHSPQLKKISKKISSKTSISGTSKSFTRAFDKILDYSNINKIHIMFSSVSS